VNTISDGFVEWDMTGLKERNNSINEFMLFGMWDPDAGAYRENPFRVHLQKLHPPQHNPPFMRLRWISQGDLFEEGRNFTEWDPNRTYTFRVDWSKLSDDSFFARVFLDNRMMIELEYGPGAYTPSTHWIEMGIAARRESVTGAIYSNVRIVER
jgi:hypothetical protein